MTRAAYIRRVRGCTTFYDGKLGRGPHWHRDLPTVEFYNKETVDKLRNLGFVVPKELELVEVVSARV